MLSEFKIGPRQGTNNTVVEGRVDKTGSMVTNDGHARYQEMSLQGGLFSLSTAVAGVTIAAANVYTAANPQPLVGIYNPSNSGKNAVIIRGGSTWNSGTSGTGGLVWAVQVAPPIALTSAGVVTSAVNGFNMADTSSMRQFINVAMTGAVLLLYRYAGGPTAGALAANGMHTYMDEMAGEIIVPPGACAGLFAAAAGTSPIVNAFMAWEEISA